MKSGVLARKFKTVARAATSRTRLLGSIYVSFCKRFPVRPNKVMLESHQGKDFFGNPFYLARHILQSEHFTAFEVIIVCPYRAKRRVRQSLPAGNVRYCRPRSIRYAYHLATAGYLINDVAFPLYFSRRTQQKYLNTWHGTPLKSMGRKCAQGGLELLSNPQRNFLHTTHLLAPNKHTEQVLLRDYMIEKLWTGTVIRCGYPRNDVLVNSATSETQSQSTSMNVAFLPTWRAKSNVLDHASSKQLEQLKSLFAQLDDELSQDVTVWVRLHPLLGKSIPLHEYRRIKPFPDSLEPYQHLAICDVLVSDYSSVVVDFAATRKPILLYAPDVQDYRQERGFCLEPELLPFRHITSAKALAKAISEMKRSTFQPAEQYEEFAASYCSLDGGSSSEAVCAHYFFESGTAEIHCSAANKLPRNVLIFCGSLQNNGITASLKSLVSLIDPDRCNVILWFDIEMARKNAPDFPQSLGLKTAYLASRSELMVSFSEGLRLLAIGSELDKKESRRHFHRDLWKREWKRLFGNAHIDALVHFSGYERRVCSLLTVTSARKLIFVHNEMIEEISTKGVHSPSLKAAYKAADVIALVREGMDQQFHAQIGAIDGKTRFVPNTLKTNYREMSQAPLLESISSETSETRRNKLEEMFAKANAFRFFNLARFAVEKGQERLIEAFEIVWEEHPECQLFILGGYGPIFQKLIERANRSPAAESILVAQGSQNPFPLFARMDALVLASFYEGKPIVPYEAFALDVPVVSTKIPGPTEILDGGYGLLVPNSTKGLVHGMRVALRGEIPSKPFDLEAHNRFAMEQFYIAVGV